ncbi:2-oxoacid:acceptor oxidoreductase family protein [Chloroflexota bacterium]
MANRHEVRLCGFGGQGIILAGYIIGQAASIFDGKSATFIQDYGPEARGGACRADVVISDEPVSYPYIHAPSLLVALSQPGYDKYRPRNRKDSLMIIDEELVKHRETRKDKLFTIPSRRMAEELGRVAVANIIVVGFLAAVTEIVSIEAIRESVLTSVPKGTEELNTKALEKGYAYGREKLDSTRGLV